MSWRNWGSRREKRDSTKHLLDRKPKGPIPKFTPGVRTAIIDNDGNTGITSEFRLRDRTIQWNVNYESRTVWVNQSELKFRTGAPQ